MRQLKDASPPPPSLREVPRETALRPSPSRPWDPITALGVPAVVLSLMVFVVYPLLWVFGACVRSDIAVETFASRHFLRPALNSLILGLLVGVLGTTVGFVFAYAITRRALPFTGGIRRLATLPLIAPPFVIALAAILLFGRNGVVTRDLLLKRLGVDLYAAGFDIYGLGGLVFVETLSYFPTAFLLLAGVLSAMDPSMEEASISLGAGRLRTFFRVTLPLTFPALFASFLLIFIESLADFGNPLVLGGRFNVLSVQAYLQIVGNDNQAGGSLMALALLVPSIAVYVFQTGWLEKKSFVTVTGKASRPPVGSVNRLGRAVLALVCVPLLVMTVLLYGLVVYGSLVKVWGLDPTLTLKNYADAFGGSMDDLKDTTWLGLLSAPLTTVFAFFTAYLIERRRFRGRRVLETLAMLTFAIPGTVVGIGYALAFSRPPLVLTGTAAIVVSLLAFRNLPVGMKAAAASLKQMDPALEEAAANLGRSPWGVLRTVTVPLLAPALFSSISFSFVRAVTAVSAVIFVVSAQWNLLTVGILAYVESSDLSHAAALAVLLVVLVLGVFEGARWGIHRAFPGRFSEV